MTQSKVEKMRDLLEDALAHVNAGEQIGRANGKNRVLTQLREAAAEIDPPPAP